MTQTDHTATVPTSVDELQKALQENLYVADRSLAISIYLALKLRRPLFLEGEAGVGKTEIAKVLAAALDTRLIRLQCYEGLDVNQAVYEWNYSRQLLEIRLLEASERFSDDEAEQELFSEKFLIKRPAAAGHRVERREAARAAHRRTRPRGRGIRGIPAGTALGLSDNHPGARHVPRGGAAVRHHHVEPDAGNPRRIEAAVPVLLD